MLIKIMLIVVMIYESFLDIKSRQVQVIPLVIMGIVGMCFNLVWQGKEIGWFLTSAAAGAALFLTGKITRQSIGYGDCVVFLVIGLCLGAGTAIGILWIALLMAGINGVLIILLKRRQKNMRLPLCPYILAGLIMKYVIF